MKKRRCRHSLCLHKLNLLLHQQVVCKVDTTQDETAKPIIASLLEKALWGDFVIHRMDEWMDVKRFLWVHHHLFLGAAEMKRTLLPRMNASPYLACNWPSTLYSSVCSKAMFRYLYSSIRGPNFHSLYTSMLLASYSESAPSKTNTASSTHPSRQANTPRYSIPEFSLTRTGRPKTDFKKSDGERLLSCIDGSQNGSEILHHGKLETTREREVEIVRLLYAFAVVLLFPSKTSSSLKIRLRGGN